MPTKLRPTKTHSRRFDAAKSEADEHGLETDPGNLLSSKPKPSRSTSYTNPLPLGNRTKPSQNSAPLTRENLESHLSGLEKQKSAPPSAPIVAEDQGHMRKTKSPKKSSDKKKSKPDLDSHPLNLPPDELRRLSAAMAREEARNSTPVDVDNEQSMTNGASEPPTPSQEAPGAFPEPEADDVSDREEKSPTPPPHKAPPKVDPESCKAAGNKFFKAKDYDRAIQEYTKGKPLPSSAPQSANI
jgi:DnaJ homolog subfamily C member 7